MESPMLPIIEKDENLNNVLEKAINLVDVLSTKIDLMQRHLAPIYDYYKPFKDVEVNKTFALRSHLYKKVDEFNMLGNRANVFDMNYNQYDYILDYEWVIEL